MSWRPEGAYLVTYADTSVDLKNQVLEGQTPAYDSPGLRRGL